jgi:lipopolysaccharide export system permease protein
MKSITWYIVRQVTAVTLLAAFVLCFMVWLFRSLDIVDMMLNRGLALADFLHFASLQLPRFFLFVGPMAVFGAALFTYNKMIMDSELIVLRSAGLSPIALAKPAMIVGTVVSLFSLFLSIYLVPLTYREYKELEFKYRQDLPKLLLQEGVFTNLTKGITVYFQDVGQEGELRNVIIHDNRNRVQPMTYVAEWGRLMESRDGRWMAELSKGSGQVLKRGIPECSADKAAAGTANGCAFPRFEYFVGDRADNFSLNLFDSDEKRTGRNTREYFLMELVNSAADNPRRPTLIAEFHSRLTKPFLPLTCALLGVAIILSGNFNRRGQLKLVLLAIMIAGALIIGSHVLRNYAPKFPLLNFAMYANVVVPLIASLLVLWFPRPLSRGSASAMGPPAT